MLRESDSTSRRYSVFPCLRKGESPVPSVRFVPAGVVANLPVAVPSARPARIAAVIVRAPMMVATMVPVGRSFVYLASAHAATALAGSSSSPATGEHDGNLSGCGGSGKQIGRAGGGRLSINGPGHQKDESRDRDCCQRRLYDHVRSHVLVLSCPRLGRKRH